MPVRKILGTASAAAETPNYAQMLIALNGWGPGPIGHNGLAWTNDPAHSSANAIPAVGRFSATRFRAAASGSCGNIVLSITTAGSSITTGLVAIFNLDGTINGAVSANQTTAWQSTGEKTVALGSPATLVAGVEYVFVLLQAGSTGATFSGSLGSSRPNQGITASTTNPRRQGISTATSQTTMPSTLNWTAFGDVGNAPCAIMKA